MLAAANQENIGAVRLSQNAEGSSTRWRYREIEGSPTPVCMYVESFLLHKLSGVEWWENQSTKLAARLQINSQRCKNQQGIESYIICRHYGSDNKLTMEPHSS